MEYLSLQEYTCHIKARQKVTDRLLGGCSYSSYIAAQTLSRRPKLTLMLKFIVIALLLPCILGIFIFARVDLSHQGEAKGHWQTPGWVILLLLCCCLHLRSFGKIYSNWFMHAWNMDSRALLHIRDTLILQKHKSLRISKRKRMENTKIERKLQERLRVTGGVVWMISYF